MSTMNTTGTEPEFFTLFGLWDTHIPESLSKIQQLNKANQFNVQILSVNTIVRHINHDSEMKRIYNSIPRRVCLADIARLYMMREYEGFYVDMDILLKSNMHAFLEAFRNKKLLLFCEHDQCNPLHMGARENKAHTRRIFNCILGSTDKHANRPFWDACIELCKKRASSLLALGTRYVWTDSDVIWATGPDVITTVYHEMYDKVDMCVISRKDSDYYFQHCETGTWRNNNDT